MTEGPRVVSPALKAFVDEAAKKDRVAAAKEAERRDEMKGGFNWFFRKLQEAQAHFAERDLNDWRVATLATRGIFGPVEQRGNVEAGAVEGLGADLTSFFERHGKENIGFLMIDDKSGGKHMRAYLLKADFNGRQDVYLAVGDMKSGSESGLVCAVCIRGDSGKNGKIGVDAWADRRGFYPDEGDVKDGYAVSGVLKMIAEVAVRGAGEGWRLER